MSPADQAAIRQALEDTFEYLGIVYPGMATIVGQITHQAMPDGMTKAIACASRTTCFYSLRFIDLPIEQRAGLVIHESFHVVLQHAERTIRLEASVGRVARDTMNRAMDLIINTMIVPEGTSSLDGHIALPPDGITMPTMERIFKGALAECDYANRHGLKTWQAVAAEDADTVYTVLKETGMPEDSECDLVAISEPDSPFEHPETGDEARKVFQTALVASVSAMAGSDPGGLISGLMARLPSPVIPWRSHLRSLLLKQASKRRETTWTERSRRMAAMPPGTVSMPGTTRGRAPRIVAIIDTSASVSNAAITAFMGEVQGIATTTGAAVTQIEADTAVSRITTVRHDGARTVALADAGRGGTAFDPALRAADGFAPSAIVYLTDLCAAAPSFRPKAPVIWCAIGGAPSMPFGRRVQMPVEL